MKVSEILVSDVVNSMKLEIGDYSEMEIQILLDTAKSYIKSYTGLDAAGIDLHEEFVHVVYVLCQDMHDNRAMYVDKTSLNMVVTTILDMHRTNLLPTPDEVI